MLITPPHSRSSNSPVLRESCSNKHTTTGASQLSLGCWKQHHTVTHSTRRNRGGNESQQIGVSVSLALSTAAATVHTPPVLDVCSSPANAINCIPEYSGTLRLGFSDHSTGSQSEWWPHWTQKPQREKERER